MQQTRKIYQKLDGRSSILNKAPDAQETSDFWSNIWSTPGNLNENASWLSKTKERLSEIDKQEDIRIIVENVKTAIRKMTNWKAPGTDCVQGYQFKRFSTLNSRLTEHLQTCIVVGNVPSWMTQGKTTLIMKDPNAANNYLPIACLLPMRKLLTSVLGQKVYAHLSEKNVLPDEQKGCRKDSGGKTHGKRRTKT